MHEFALQKNLTDMGLSENLQRLTGAWSTDVLPTATTLTHINPTNVAGVVETLLSASSAYPTITKPLDLYLLARAVKGAKASLSVISAQNYIATATATQNFPEMTQVIWNSTMELQDLEMGFNLYQMKLSRWANLTFAIVFALLVVSHLGISLVKRTPYFGVCLVAGSLLEAAGYIARLMSIGNYSDKDRYICQIICLTLAPAFVMAGVYYLLAQLMVIHGRKYTILRPLWYSYIFIVCDICSLFIQAAGGGLAAIRLQVLESTKVGTIIMTVGVAFQVFSMTLFLFFLINFLWRIYFKASSNVKFLVAKLGALFFQTRRGKDLQQQELNQMYDQRFRETIDRPLFGYYPLAIVGACFFIYVRCIYRLIELSEGWSGYLITHEEYVMTLDGLQVLITCVILLAFHPGLILGKTFSGSIRDSGFPETDTERQNYPYSTNEEKLRDLSLDWSVDESLLKESVAGQQYSSHEQDDGNTFNVIPYYTTPKQSPFSDSSEWKEPMSGSSNSLELPFASPYDTIAQIKITPNPAKEVLNPVVEDEIMTVPYLLCPENPSVTTPTPKKKSRRFSKSTRKSDSISVNSAAVNPYEREGVDVIKTSGPYELYERPELANEMHIDHSDVESRVTHDEFFFTFVTKNQNTSK